MGITNDNFKDFILKSNLDKNDYNLLKDAVDFKVYDGGDDGFCEYIIQPHRKTLLIVSCYCSTDKTKEHFNKIVNIAKENNCNKVEATTYKKELANLAVSNYGFKVASYNLTQNIEKGE